MKINDLIPQQKIYDELDRWASNNLRDFYRKNNYYLNLSCHSSNKYWLMNNYEKDIVIAYVKNSFGCIILTYSNKTFRRILYIDYKKLCSGKIYSYSLFDYEISSYEKDMYKSFNNFGDEVIVVDNSSYEKFIKLGILNSLKESNQDG